MTTTWEETVFRVTAPGATAIGRYQNGNVNVEVTISLLAAFVAKRIVEDVETSLRDAGCQGVRSTPS